MKKIFIYSAFLLLFVIATTSCDFFNDDDYQASLEQLEKYKQQVREQYIIDSTLIVEYLVENDSSALYLNNSGIFYKILEDGDNNHPSTNSTVQTRYKGMLLDGTIFEQTPDSVASNSFYLDNLILGWQIGVPLIGTDGKIILYLPSYLGFGTLEKKDVPANSVLIFEIHLIDFY